MVQWSLWVRRLLNLQPTDCNNVFLNILIIHENCHHIACCWKHREESRGTVLTMLNLNTTLRQLNPRERDVVSTVQQVGRNREQVWKAKYFLSPPGFELQIVQCVKRRYTVYANLTPHLPNKYPFFPEYYLYFYHCNGKALWCLWSITHHHQ